MSAKQPWLKFYPADWREDAGLRLCSIGARGLWVEMLCLMWQADPCGSLVRNGKPISPDALAILAGITLKESKALLAELQAEQVFSTDDDGTIYSRRMRRDIRKAEQDRENGKGGGNPLLRAGVNPPDKPRGNGGDKAQKPEARSHMPEASPPDPPGPDRGGGQAGLSNEFRGRLVHAVLTVPCVRDDDFGPVEVLLAEGCTEADVLEGTRVAVQKSTEPIRHWSGFAGWVRRARDDRLAGVRRIGGGTLLSPEAAAAALAKRDELRARGVLV